LSSDGLPVPPAELAVRVGVAADADPVRFYLDEGARLRTVIERLVPEGWEWAGKRVLDFGCGSARVLRHFAAEAAAAQFIGCDIDEPSIEWASRNLSPPFRFIRNDFVPPLALEPGSLDLILAMSVYTHISDTWADWILEMHRLLAPGGILLATFLGEGMWEALIGEPYHEDRVGMAVLRKWDGPYAWVFHSEWWLRTHWGEAFEFERVERPARDRDGHPEVAHSYLVLRRRSRTVTKPELERINPTEPRELAGLQTGLRLARRDIEYLTERQRELVAPSALRVALRRVKRNLTARASR
jgi:SAM-dependent methyltransferase